MTAIGIIGIRPHVFGVPGPPTMAELAHRDTLFSLNELPAGGVVGRCVLAHRSAPIEPCLGVSPARAFSAQTDVPEARRGRPPLGWPWELPLPPTPPASPAAVTNRFVCPPTLGELLDVFA